MLVQVLQHSSNQVQPNHSDSEVISALKQNIQKYCDAYSDDIKAQNLVMNIHVNDTPEQIKG